MNLSQLFTLCLFGHDEPIKVMEGKVFRFQCPNCQMDLGAVLPGQRFKPRREKKRSRKSADVLRLEKRRA